MQARKPRRGRKRRESSASKNATKMLLEVQSRVRTFLHKGPSPMKKPHQMVVRLQVTQDSFDSEDLRLSEHAPFTVVATSSGSELFCDRRGVMTPSFVHRLEGSRKLAMAAGSGDFDAVVGMAISDAQVRAPAGALHYKVLQHAQLDSKGPTVRHPKFGRIRLPFRRYAHFDTEFYTPRLRNEGLYPHRMCTPNSPDEAWPVWAVYDVQQKEVFMWCYEEPALRAIGERRAMVPEKDVWLTSWRGSPPDAEARQAAVLSWHPTSEETDTGGQHMLNIADILYGDPPPEIVVPEVAIKTCPWLELPQQ